MTGFPTVRGDSMDRTGLHGGDVVTIRADAEPCNGKIVVAHLDNEVTLRRRQRIDEQTVELRPASRNEGHTATRRTAPKRRDVSTDKHSVARSNSTDYLRYPMDEYTSPTETYSIGCTGDVVVGDRVRFDEAVFAGSHRRPKFQGVRTIEAEIVADSYGAERQQHTFSMIVLACSGLSPLEPGERIRRKARNVYQREAWRAPWSDESARDQAAEEKHARGDAARAQRDRRRAEEGWWDRF